MGRFIAIIIFISFIFFSSDLYAQSKHTSHPPKDSLKIYKQIKKISERKKLTKLLYKEIFVTPNDDKTRFKKSKTKVAKSLNRYRGKIIRNIIYTSLDPFGYDIYDTSSRAKSLFERSGNFVHIKSKKITISNHLLFGKGDSLDLFKIKESERLIRSSNYIKDALISIKPTSSKDSVDIYILTQDRWSINFDVQASTSNYNGKIITNNFLGLGHSVTQNIYSSAWKDSIVNFAGLYSVPLIKNTFITASAFYSTDKFNHYKGVQVSRNFYSPLARWAGGIDIANYRTPTMLFSSDTGKLLITLDRNNYDFWAAQSIGIGTNNDEKGRATRLIYGVRYWQRDYGETLPTELDKFSTFQNHKTAFSTVGISYRGFYKDEYIFRYGTTEDVPIGNSLSITAGIDSRGNYFRYYAGIATGFSKRYERIGYISSRLAIGSYFNKGKEEQGAVRLSANYFTELIKIGSWKLRQFVSMDAVYGITRDRNEYLNINNQSGLRGFNSPTLIGSNKLVIILQSQFYLPYSFLGFRFAPIIYLGFGQVGNQQRLFITQKVYPVIAFGMQIRNELLILNTFQFIIGIYPVIPGVDGASFKINPVRTYDFQFTNHEIGKPDVVPYY